MPKLSCYSFFRDIVPVLLVPGILLSALVRTVHSAREKQYYTLLVPIETDLFATETII